MRGAFQEESQSKEQAMKKSKKAGKTKIFALKVSETDKKTMDFIARYRRQTLTSIFIPAFKEALAYEYGDVVLSILSEKVFSSPAVAKRIKNPIRCAEKDKERKNISLGSGYATSQQRDIPELSPKNAIGESLYDTLPSQSDIAINTIVEFLIYTAAGELREIFTGIILEHREWMLYEMDKKQITREIGAALLKKDEFEVKGHRNIRNALVVVLEIIIKHYFDLTAIGSARMLSSAWMRAQPALASFITRTAEEWVKAAGETTAEIISPDANSIVERKRDIEDEVIEIEDVEYIKSEEVKRK
ncbi:MAG: hypothetical protein QW728_05785 [Thermoplasmata archaeon]